VLQPCLIMNESGLKKPRRPYRALGVACGMLLLCVCVVMQMLGAPFTLLGLSNSDMFTELEPVSEDFSALSPSPEPERPRFFRLFNEFCPALHLPLLLTSVFRPPAT
jgi:hypothetical protein